MINRFFTLFTLSPIFFSILVAQTPITITNADMPTNLDTLRFSKAKLSSLGDYTVTGVNYNWDFTSLEPISQGLRSFINPSNTPYSTFFSGFNGSSEKMTGVLIAISGVSMTDFYKFYKQSTANPNAYLADAMGLTVNGIPVSCYYEDKDEIYNFPLSYLQFDSTSFRVSTPITTLITSGYSSTGKRATRVDGWGTISTPFGTVPCLRVVSTVYSFDSLKYVSVPSALYKPKRTMRSYQWLTNALINGQPVHIPVLEITGLISDDPFLPINYFSIHQVIYRDVYRDPLAIGLTEQTGLSNIAFYPNPVNEKLYFKNDERLEGVQLNINDVLGKAVYEKTLHLELGVSTSSISVADLKPGLYFVSLQKNNQRATFKFIKN